MYFTEDMFEQAVIELLQGLGYTHIYAPDLNREDFSDPLMESALLDSLVRINKKLPIEAVHEAIAKLRNFEGGSLVEKNKTFTGYLQNGVEVKYFYKGEERASIVYLIDYDKAENNTFYVVNQYTYIENGNNGILVVVFNRLAVGVGTHREGGIHRSHSGKHSRIFLEHIPGFASAHGEAGGEDALFINRILFF